MTDKGWMPNRSITRRKGNHRKKYKKLWKAICFRFMRRILRIDCTNGTVVVRALFVRRTSSRAEFCPCWTELKNKSPILSNSPEGIAYLSAPLFVGKHISNWRNDISDRETSFFRNKNYCQPWRRQNQEIYTSNQSTLLRWFQSDDRENLNRLMLILVVPFLIWVE